MVATIANNPYASTNAAGSFNIKSGGLIQGTAYPDPATRYQLAGGLLATTETLPMWGGVGISELVPQSGITKPVVALGTIVSRASTFVAYAAGQLTGFSVFDQAHAMVNTPASPVPLAGSGMQVNLYRLGSNARIAVAVDPALVTLQGTLITSELSWDFTNQQLIGYEPVVGSTAITSAAWSAGVVTALVASTAALATGDTLIVAGLIGSIVPGGYNGTYDVTVVDGTHFSYPVAVNPGTQSGSGTYQSAGGGILPCKVLDVDIGNSMTVVYNATTGFATWNRTGSCAVIQI
jgi:hypothetical protein